MPSETVKVEQEKALLTWIGKSRPTNSTESQIKPILMVLGILVAIILIFANEWMMLWVLAAGVFYYYATRKSEAMEVEFTLFNKGMLAFGKKYRWEEMARWWWDDKIISKTLVVELTQGFLGRLYIPTDGANFREIEKIMEKHLVMDKPQETWTDKIEKWVKEKFPLENKI